MLGRTAVNRAQVDYYDEYGSPKQGMKIDPEDPVRRRRLRFATI
jgi:hypothetical protein